MRGGLLRVSFERTRPKVRGAIILFGHLEDSKKPFDAQKSGISSNLMP